MDERIKTIADHYGLNHQIDKLAEESAEMIVAELQLITKVDTVDKNTLAENFISELADVDIVLEQVKYLLNQEQRIFFIREREKKIARTLERIEAEK